MVNTTNGLVVGVGLAALVLGLSAQGPPRAEVRQARAPAHNIQPDIVLVLADDQPQGLLDAMPQVRRHLGEFGMRYTHAVVPTALCTPSRASILTGRHAHDTGVWDNGMRQVDGRLVGGYHAFVRGGNQTKTLAYALHHAGYRTGLVGKYLNQYRRHDRRPPGWDVWRPFQGGASYYHYVLGGHRHGDRTHDYSTDVITQTAVRMIDNTARDRPLFLVAAPFGPHSPFTPARRDRGAPVGRYLHPADFAGLNERNVSDKPAWVQRLAPLSGASVRGVARAQHRAVMSVDDLVGGVVDALRRRGSIHNTLLVFMSDNGYLWGAHRILGKDVPYRDATEVPLLLRDDGVLAGGQLRHRLVTSLDVTATLADAGGVRSAMPWVEGRSLISAQTQRSWSIVEGTFNDQHQRFMQRPPYCGLRTQRGLFVKYTSGDREFYWYPTGRSEMKNQIASQRWAPRIRAMRSIARSACTPPPPGFSWS